MGRRNVAPFDLPLALEMFNFKQIAMTGDGAPHAPRPALREIGGICS